MQIPVVDPSEIPFIVRDDDDWRARYDKLRETYPFFRVGDDPTVWFTRYDACREILLNGDLFWEGAWGKDGHGPYGRQRSGAAWDRESAEEGMRRHIIVRQALMQFLNPQRAMAWEERMHSACAELMDPIPPRGRADFVHDFSRAYFPFIGADMLGAPRSDWDMLVEWEHEVFKVPEHIEGHMLNMENDALQNILDYIEKLRVEKRANPDDRLLSWIVQAEDSGALTPAEANWAATTFVLGSGHTVTSHLGYVFRYLSVRPELQARVVADPDSVNAMCEELLRLYSLFGHTRTVTSDIEFHGCPLKAGDRVFIDYSIPNRDPRVPGWDHVDLDRKVNRHIGWNQGWRQCIGIHFARRARNIAVQEWHKRIPSYRLASEGPLLEQVYAGVGYHELPLVWRSA